MALSFDASEGGILTIDSQRSPPAPFLTKTYQLVDDRASDHIVSWGEDGATFIVWRPAEFARDLLPNYFKHNNFSSFVRQLNTYGFRKIVPDRWEFANEFFRKGEKQLLTEIQRRKASQQASTNRSSPTLSMEEQAWPSSHSSPVSINYQHAVIALSNENEKLRQDNALLICELSHLRKLYNDVILFVQQHVRLPCKEACRFRRIICQTKGVFTPALLLEEASAARLSDTATDKTDRQEIIQNPPLSMPFAFSQHKNNSLSSCRAPTVSFVDGKFQEFRSPANETRVAVGGDEKVPPKLFGVPLQGKKRLHFEDVDDEKLGEGEVVTADTFENMPSFKNLKIDLALELRPSAIQAPWLRLCSQRDERVFST